MLFRSLAIFLFFISSRAAFPQVGFNNPAPDPSAILDLTANDKGLLIPRLTTAQREAIELNLTPGRSLMVFDVTLGTFCFYDAGKWYIINEWVREAGNNDVSSVENVTVNGTLKVVGTVTAPDYALNATGNGPVPKGGIIMWSGAVNTVPAGWALCDGRPGTPNLSNKFIVSAGSSYSVGTQGGADEVTLRADQSGLPAHTHILDDPGHKHRALAGSTSNFGDYFAEDAGNAKTDSWKTTETAKTGITMRLNSTQNASQPFDNRPAYYALAYIIKL